ncbi:MAG TPA: MFS transporter [Candidatus Caccoplasma intestinavium]|uniref:MFS transporter n=1 Tax=Candidatus Caccoplasma intestinavium TaxID=2840716 RepID=A0A9D1GFJ1_9BACT|nr:MFS transporter [Candidatus Caccoplasma intestinavium]
MRKHLQLKDDEGVPASLLFIMACMAAVSVANIYYCQPLLSLMGNDLGIDEWRASLIAMITQVGYACGLFFIIPSGDKFDRKKIVSYSFSILTIALLCIALSNNFHAVMAASFAVGVCSVMPQIFIPIAAQYSRPEKKGANVGLIVSGLLTGILASRVISGLVGEWLGWRSMYVIAAIVMSLCTLIVWRIMPYTENNYTGSYKRLMHSLFALIREYKLLRICALRAAFAFGSFLALWASLTFKMEQAPFYAGSDVVGLLGLCGVAGAMSASVVGRLVSRIGVHNFNLLGAALMLSAWIIAYLWGNTYTAIIITILILDIGMQCIQLSNQTVVFSINPKASNRINTIFMTNYFIGGSLGTFLSGSAWSMAGWSGVTIVGIGLAFCSLCITLFSKQ